MATRLYLQATSNLLSGTFPTASTSSVGAPSWSAVGATTIRMMDYEIGPSMSNLGGTSGAVTTILKGLFGMFVSPPIVGDQTIGGGTWTFNAADSESNLAANAWFSMVNVYVWRPSTGSKVGTISDTGTQSGGLEPLATTIQVSTFTRTTSAISALSGDVIMFEAWTSHVQGAATARNMRLYFGGTTVNTTENAVVTNHASFVEMSEEVRFSPPQPITQDGFF
jgi:hypothetical protein